MTADEAEIARVRRAIDIQARMLERRGRHKEAAEVRARQPILAGDEPSPVATSRSESEPGKAESVLYTKKFLKALGKPQPGPTPSPLKVYLKDYPVDNRGFVVISYDDLVRTHAEAGDGEIFLPLVPMIEVAEEAARPEKKGKARSAITGRYAKTVRSKALKNPSAHTRRKSS
jgi:hypothetical protein